MVTDCKNFKVRINAALALGSPAERCHYGNPDLYLHIWESLIKGLQTAEEITDFAEYRYRDSLNDHVCTDNQLSGIFLTNIKTRLHDQSFPSKILTKFWMENWHKENFVKVILFTRSKFGQSWIKVSISCYLLAVNSKTNNRS